VTSKKFYLDGGSSLNIRNKPLTKDWKERFSLPTDVTPQEIYQVVEPGDSIRIIDHTREYDNPIPKVSEYLPGTVDSPAVKDSPVPWEVWHQVIQRLLDSVNRLNEREANERFRLSVFREFVDRDWEKEGYTVAQVYPSP
jgi:hypothetical protein